MVNSCFSIMIRLFGLLSEKNVTLRLGGSYRLYFGFFIYRSSVGACSLQYHAGNTTLCGLINPCWASKFYLFNAVKNYHKTIKLIIFGIFSQLKTFHTQKFILNSTLKCKFIIVTIKLLILYMLMLFWYQEYSVP